MKTIGLIREARISDAAAIARLSIELGYAASEAAMTQRLQQLIGRDDQCVRVAEVDGQITGWIQVSTAITLESGFRAEIVGLIVSSRHRRNGIGRRLVETVMAWAANKDIEAVVVRSNVQRTESHQFYPSIGFLMSKTQAVYRKVLKE